MPVSGLYTLCSWRGWQEEFNRARKKGSGTGSCTFQRVSDGGEECWCWAWSHDLGKSERHLARSFLFRERDVNNLNTNEKTSFPQTRHCLNDGNANLASILTKWIWRIDRLPAALSTVTAQPAGSYANGGVRSQCKNSGRSANRGTGLTTGGERGWVLLFVETPPSAGATVRKQWRVAANLTLSCILVLQFYFIIKEMLKTYS